MCRVYFYIGSAAMSRSSPNRDSVASARTVANMLRFVQALRRSIKGEKDKGPQVSIAPKSAVAIVPPKKVSPIVRHPRGVRFVCPPPPPRSAGCEDATLPLPAQVIRPLC